MTDLKNYAEAIFLIAEEDGALSAVKEELYTVKKALADNPEYASLLDNPALSKSERLQLVGQAFSALSENSLNLIKILTEKRSVSAFGKLYSEFLGLYNKKMGIIPVEAISAVALSREQTERLASKLSSRLNGTVEIRNTVDPSILGGIILRYQSLQLDGSVKARLDAIAKDLRSAVL